MVQIGVKTHLTECKHVKWVSRHFKIVNALNAVKTKTTSSILHFPTTNNNYIFLHYLTHNSPAHLFAFLFTFHPSCRVKMLQSYQWKDGVFLNKLKTNTFQAVVINKDIFVKVCIWFIWAGDGLRLIISKKPNFVPTLSNYSHVKRLDIVKLVNLLSIIRPCICSYVCSVVPLLQALQPFAGGDLRVR